MFFSLIVLLPETLFYIWANFIIYATGIYECLEEAESDYLLPVSTLWWTVFGIVIYGYYYFISSCVYCCIASGMAYVYRSWTKPEEVSTRVDKLVEEKKEKITSRIN